MQTILLIETDPATLLTLSLVLRCFGYTVLEATSRGEAWRVCHEHEGPIHLILTQAIPGGSSGEFITRLQLLYPQVCAVFFSDASTEEMPDPLRIPCGYSFLPKPFPVEALARTIRDLLYDPKTKAVSSFS